MADKTFWDLVKLALPEDVHPRELLVLSPQKWWNEKPYLASAHALRKSPRINWEAYLARNEDVRNSGMDPCLHWLKHGIFEGRKLISWHPLKEPEKYGRPLVSIVIINYNNAHFLEKCIGSVVDQTLHDIEVIIVDDCSTDESLDIIRGFAANDNRIKVLVNPENSLTMITRKRGVEAATGRYIMFLDSDDYLACNACEVAAKEIEKGYDLVKFGVNVVHLKNVPLETIVDCDQYCNRGENEEYFYNEITNAIFRDGRTSWNLWSLIYLREISVAAFRELGEERLTGPDDLLATMASVRRARSMLKIPDRLICYYFGPGITVSTNKTKIFKYAPAICKTTKFIFDYAKQFCSNIVPQHLYLNLCEHVAKRFLPIAMEPETPQHFKELMDILGFMYVLRVLIYNHSNDLNEIASLFPPVKISNHTPRHIGIYISPAKRHDLLDLAQIIVTLLFKKNYKITFFVEGEDANLTSLTENIYYLPRWKDGHDFPDYLELLSQSIVASGIEIMFHAACHSNSFWEAALLQSKAIPLIFVYPCDSPLLPKNPQYSVDSSYEHAMRCALATICATSLEAAYWTSKGIKAAHLMPPPITEVNNKVTGNGSKSLKQESSQSFSSGLVDLLEHVFKADFHGWKPAVKKSFGNNSIA